MSKILALREKAKKDKKIIVLPEGEDERIVKGAAVLADEGLANVCLLGKKEDILKLAEQESVSMDNVNIVDPQEHDRKEDVINNYFQKRKHKGITPEEAAETVLGNYVYYAAEMTQMGLGDGFVAGACHTTGDVARSAIHCFKIDRSIGTVSSSFIMEMAESSFGEDGMFAYGDCGIIPYPSIRQLSGIAIATSDLFGKLFGVEPRVALLSYSTKGSASGESIETIRAALERIRGKRPNLKIDGELQLDSAIVPDVAARKCPDSPIGGKANVLIFPNLDAGNISYKLSQRLGNARAVGPLIQGIDHPCSDLSRGCSWEDVVDTAVVTAIRAQGL
ncbi:MAG: phosphate acetyltransferase [Candidatus Tantalella remota]|nr:phosphate acetyltransferase [Candidatus Tantalella remota]